MQILALEEWKRMKAQTLNFNPKPEFPRSLNAGAREVCGWEVWIWKGPRKHTDQRLPRKTCTVLSQLAL